MRMIVYEDLNETRYSDSETDRQRYHQLVSELAGKRGLKINKTARVFVWKLM